jgi:hypothetical protein
MQIAQDVIVDDVAPQVATQAPSVTGARPIEAIPVSAFAHSMLANGEAWFWTFRR